MALATFKLDKACPEAAQLELLRETQRVIRTRTVTIDILRYKDNKMATAQVCCSVQSIVPGYDVVMFQALRVGRWPLPPAGLFPTLFRGMGHVEVHQRLVVQGYCGFSRSLRVSCRIAIVSASFLGAIISYAIVC
jgi:hypothetical protein